MAVAPYRYRIVVSNTSNVSGTSNNVFNIGNDVALADATITNMLNAIKNFYAALATYVNGTFSIGSRVLEYRPGVPAPRIVPVAAVTQVLTASSPLPAQLAAVMAWRTALAGRRYRGRTYIGPLNQAALTNQSLNGTFITNANAAAATMITAIKALPTAGYGLVVHSDAAPDDTLIASGNMDTRPDTIRSRN